jgi:hypothetical protein
MNAVIALALSAIAVRCPVTFPADSPAPPSEDRCFCPELAPGWLLFDDSSWRTPDFWRADSLEVLEISLCAHGIAFIFLATDGGNLYLSSLMIADPDVASERLRHQVAAREGDAETKRRKYAAIVSGVCRLAEGSLRTGSRVDLRQASGAAKAWIVSPAGRLSLRWYGEEFRLRGYLDVYLSALV